MRLLLKAVAILILVFFVAWMVTMLASVVMGAPLVPPGHPPVDLKGRIIKPLLSPKAESQKLYRTDTNRAPLNPLTTRK